MINSDALMKTPDVFHPHHILLQFAKLQNFQKQKIVYVSNNKIARSE